MSSVAIILAVGSYTKQNDLACCLQDMAAMRALVEASGRYSQIIEAADLDAEGMRNTVRSALIEGELYEEIFFYFSGHGFQASDGTFYFCGTTFDSRRPNATGLSQEDVHEMVRAAEPQLFVEVVDACSSGTLLVKSQQRLVPPAKDGLHDVVFLASCRDDQSSFGGEPLSRFTSALLEAVVERTEGPIYYIDVINSLRDEFMDDPVQTPFHVSQGTGRALLVDDATKLTAFRERFEKDWRSAVETSVETEDHGDTDESESRELVVAAPLSLVERLRVAEEKMPTAEIIKSLVDELFDGVTERFQVGEFSELFDVETEAHSTFNEPTARDFIIQIMSRQPRSDRLVTAEIRRVQKKPTAYQRALDSLTASLMSAYPDFENLFDLELNCHMERAQLRLTLVPKFTSLQQLILVLTCAPSLERCYVFEIASRHARTDLNRFDDEGTELYKRWYKIDWDADIEWLVEKVCAGLEDAVRNYVNNLDERLSGDDEGTS